MTDIVELIDFYRTAAGRYRGEALQRRLTRRLPAHFGGEALALGYALPLLSGPFAEAPVLMSGAQGACRYPDAGRNRAAPVDPTALPLPDAAVGLLLAVHWLEYTDAAAAVREIARVMIPCGEAFVIVTNRFSPWTRIESVPDGCGAPFSRSRLRRIFHAADLSIVDIFAAGFAPPLPERLLLRTAPFWECIGPSTLSRCAAVHIVHARKEVYGLVRPHPKMRPHRLAWRPATPGLS